MSAILFKLLWYWIKGSCFVVLILILIAATGGTPLVEPSHSSALNWLASFGIAVTPVGAAAGLIVLWILVLILRELLPHIGVGKEDVTRVMTWTPKVSPGQHYDKSGKYVGTTTGEGKHYDAEGHYRGETTPEGSHYDESGKYKGQTTDDGRRYDEAGRYKGQTTEDGRHYGGAGEYEGKTEK